MVKLANSNQLKVHPVIWLAVILVCNILITSVTLAAWSANDNANDDPDSLKWWFAPDSVQHQSMWWDVAGANTMDQVLDWHMQWPIDV